MSGQESRSLQDREDVNYFHGGEAGLRVGDRILPPSVTGVRAMADSLPPDHELAPRAEVVTDRTKVYLTTVPEFARAFAALHPSGTFKRGGDVYRVEPEGDVEPDPDYSGEPGRSVRCGSALIVGIVATGVGRAKYVRAMAGG